MVASLVVSYVPTYIRVAFLLSIVVTYADVSLLFAPTIISGLEGRGIDF